MVQSLANCALAEAVSRLSRVRPVLHLQLVEALQLVELHPVAGALPPLPDLERRRHIDRIRDDDVGRFREDVRDEGVRVRHELDDHPIDRRPAKVVVIEPRRLDVGALLPASQLVGAEADELRREVTARGERVFVLLKKRLQQMAGQRLEAGRVAATHVDLRPMDDRRVRVGRSDGLH